MPEILRIMTSPQATSLRMLRLLRLLIIPRILRTPNILRVVGILARAQGHNYNS